MSTTVAPEKILKELADLWTTSMGDQGEAGVLRACSMTLLVMAEAADDASALGETIAALMPQHPARAILIRLQGAGERALSERVYQQCWKPFGQRQQICCEQIEITVSDAALADLPSVLLPLVVADLPVMLWCRSPRVVAKPEFREIAKVATRIVLDSAASMNATDTIAPRRQHPPRHPACRPRVDAPDPLARNALPRLRKSRHAGASVEDHEREGELRPGL